MPWASVADLRDYLDQLPASALQRVTISGAPTGGSFTLAYDGTATAAIAYNATAAAVRSALETIPAIADLVENVAGPAGGPWVVTFAAELGNNASPLVAVSSLTGGTAPAIAVDQALDAVLDQVLERATDTARQFLRDATGDPLLDYGDYAAASTRIVRGYSTLYLRVPPHQAGSLSLVEYESAASPPAYTPISDSYLDENGYIYRAAGWSGQRYRLTAAWGYGPTVPPSVVQVVLELAANYWRSRDRGGYTELVGAADGGAIRYVAALTKTQAAALQVVANQLYGVPI